ncbi:MAG: Na/Pi symporter [Pseudomonadota bacterium]
MDIKKFLHLVISLAIFLFALNYFFVSIKLLGAFKDIGLLHGKDYILMLAENPFLALLIGILITCTIQSSSTTTSIVVGLVGSFAFGEDIGQAVKIAIPFVMGANIGTSITNVLVSLGHIGNKVEFERAYSCSIVHDFFNLLTVAVIFPIQLMTNFLGKLSIFMAETFSAMGGLKFVSPLKYLVKPQASFFISLFKNEFTIDVTMIFLLVTAFLFIAKFLISRMIVQKKTNLLLFITSILFAFIFGFAKHYSDFLFNRYLAQFGFALFMLFAMLIIIVKVMKTSLLKHVEGLFHKYIFKTALRSLFLGLILTALMQSSSATTSLLVPLAGAGILNIYQIYPFTLGANCGTTITAILAALSVGQVNAVAVAFSHLIFNVVGIAIFWPLQRIPIFMAQKFAKLCMINRAIPVLAILFMYFILPMILILIFR